MHTFEKDFIHFILFNTANCKYTVHEPPANKNKLTASSQHNYLTWPDKKKEKEMDMKNVLKENVLCW